jgi:class 3 adenylate cyclase
MSDESRRIVAMMFSDIVGYTAAMGADEETAIRVVSRSREIQKDFVRKFEGQWLQEIGDGVMCSFESAVKAVSCAFEIQRALRDDPDLNLAIGIHVGDVVFRKTAIGFDVFGDAVNVAARVQSVAGAGGITISERVYDDMRNRKGMEFEFLGEKQLKNVNRPIRIYNVIDREGLGDAPAPKPRLGKAAAPEAASPLRWALPAAIAVAAAAAAAVFLMRAAPEAPETQPLPDAGSAVAERTPEAEVPVDRIAQPEGAAGEGAAEMGELETAVSPAEERPLPDKAADGSFASVRKALLSASGPWDEAGPRIWTEPDPVPNDATYLVRFEAQCDCDALIFSVDGSTEDISLLYPNPYETKAPLVAGKTFEIPSSSGYSLRAVGGQGMDFLKLFVVRGEFGFPPDGSQSWYATPEEPERVAELAALLKRLEGQQWHSVATPLHIVK